MGSVKLCPKCFSADTRRSHRRLWERLMPLVKARRCRACGQRFLRAGRPPFATCPRCGGSEVHAISRDRVPRRLSNLVPRLLGGRAYRCPNCRVHFLDRRGQRQKSGA